MHETFKAVPGIQSVLNKGLPLLLTAGVPLSAKVCYTNDFIQKSHILSYFGSTTN